MEAEALKAGKARVMDMLIDPLERDGLTRPSHQRAGDYQSFKDGIASRLAYMSADGLTVLREQIERMCVGAKGARWPKPILILNWARRIEEPPASDSRLVRSYLKSQGPMAAADGCLVELYHSLKRSGIPNSYEWSKIRARSDDNRRRAEIVRARIRRCAASSDDRAWLKNYLAVERHAARIVADETGQSIGAILGEGAKHET